MIHCANLPRAECPDNICVCCIEISEEGHQDSMITEKDLKASATGIGETGYKC